MIMSRRSVKFGLDDLNEKFRGNGDVYVTNKRLILIKSKHQTSRLSNFVSLCIPLKNVYNLEFKQPVLLASYLEGLVKPCVNSTYPLSGDSKWWISFHKGGCATFVRSFYKILLKATRKRTPEDEGNSEGKCSFSIFNRREEDVEGKKLLDLFHYFIKKNYR